MMICELQRSAVRFAWLGAVALAIASLPAHSSAQQNASASPAARNPVLVELFTSEGCSDCPPADAVLELLDTKQPIPGVQAIVLSEHVTYWNHQGWSDPFSLDIIDLHQEQYVRHFSLPSPATPEFVVDGTEQVAGNDPPKLSQEISRAAATPKLAMQIGDAHLSADGAVEFSVKADPGHKGTLVAAVAENATQSQVARGENAGRTLHYVAVVRAFKEFGSNSADGRPLRLSGSDLQRAEKDGEPLRLVVFLYNSSNGKVFAVAQQSLNR
jgi:hypothetical protein